jgi:hypothetical protein
VVESCRVPFGLQGWRASGVVPVAGRIEPAAERRQTAGTDGVVPAPDSPPTTPAPSRLPLGSWLDQYAKWVRRRSDQGAAVDVAQPRIVEAATLQKGSSGSLPSMVVAVLMAAGAAALADPPVAVATPAAALIVIVRADLIERRIPTLVLHGAAVVVPAALVLAAATLGGVGRLGWTGLLAAGVATLFTLAWLVEAVGFGALRLAFIVTMTAGWHGLYTVLALWWWASIAAFVTALVAHHRPAQQFAFAPAIALGWVLAFGLAT